MLPRDSRKTFTKQKLKYNILNLVHLTLILSRKKWSTQNERKQTKRKKVDKTKENRQNERKQTKRKKAHNTKESTQSYYIDCRSIMYWNDWKISPVTSSSLSNDFANQYVSQNGISHLSTQSAAMRAQERCTPPTIALY